MRIPKITNYKPNTMYYRFNLIIHPQPITVIFYKDLDSGEDKTISAYRLMEILYVRNIELSEKQSNKNMRPKILRSIIVAALQDHLRKTEGNIKITSVLGDLWQYETQPVLTLKTDGYGNPKVIQ